MHDSAICNEVISYHEFMNTPVRVLLYYKEESKCDPPHVQARSSDRGRQDYMKMTTKRAPNKRPHSLR